MECPYCGKNDFKQPEGLSQHLATKQPCARKCLATMSSKLVADKQAHWTPPGNIERSSSEESQGMEDHETRSMEETGSNGPPLDEDEVPETPLKL